MILHFGKYKGLDIAEIPSDYLKYLINNAKEDEVIEAAEKEYDFRDTWKTHFYEEK